MKRTLHGYRECALPCMRCLAGDSSAPDVEASGKAGEEYGSRRYMPEETAGFFSKIFFSYCNSLVRCPAQEAPSRKGQRRESLCCWLPLTPAATPAAQAMPHRTAAAQIVMCVICTCVASGEAGVRAAPGARGPLGEFPSGSAPRRASTLSRPSRAKSAQPAASRLVAPGPFPC
jgi:hypothetical protein